MSRKSVPEKIRIVREGLRDEDSIAKLCHREGISPNLYYNWSEDFLGRMPYTYSPIPKGPTTMTGEGGTPCLVVYPASACYA